MLVIGQSMAGDQGGPTMWPERRNIHVLFCVLFSRMYLEHCEEGSAEFDQLVFKDDLED